MKITYLFHSGYWIETQHYHLIFDYVTDNCKKETCLQCGKLTKELLGKDKKVIAFITHGHLDHFDGSIIKLCESLENDTVKYVISDDVVTQERPDMIFCKEGDSFAVEGVEVEVFSSTDLGVSFYVKVDGYKIFHSGDFNWWHWEGETEEEKEFARNGFFSELEKMKGKEVDVAMFPVDPRLEHAYCYGGEEYIKAVAPKMFFPMHFQGLYSTTACFAKHMGDCGTKIVEIQKRGEQFTF